MKFQEFQQGTTFFWGGGRGGGDPISHHFCIPLGGPNPDFAKVDSSISEGNGEAEDVI
jgi:hypothetical protein